MDKTKRETFLLWSETEEYKRRIDGAKKNIRTALASYTKPYVAFSGGKDSSVMLALVLEQNPDIMVFHWDYGRYYIPRDMEHAFIDDAMKIGAKNIRVRTSELYNQEKREAKNVLGRVMLGYMVPLLITEGYDLCFIGLRAEEASKRKARTKDLFEYGDITNTFPIRSLKWQDVWAYLISNNLPYPAFYDRYAKLMGYDRVRLVTFFDPEFEKFGSPYIDGVMTPEFRHVDVVLRNTKHK